ncbi:MAG TPA: trigger factor [Steroidobacteraceae bacterium]|jgi:trigger factor|nr:trigger factor [Steroidobacteraceae bacterium]
MQVSVENIGKLERRMQVQVPASQVSDEIASRLKHLSRTARLKGFRPGKAPLTVIRRQFGQQVHREVIGELMQSSFQEAVSQKQLAPAGSPRIEPKSVGEGQDLTYVATFEVFPEVTLQPVSTLSLDKVTAEVTDADVDAMIERLRKQQTKYTAVTRPAADGDKVTVDFEGTIDGVAFAGGKGENVPIVLGEARMLAQLEQGLIGAGAAESREIGVDFPADYRATELAGKHAVFKVEVKSVEEPSLPALDEEFCAVFGVTEGGVPKLREDVAANMRRELEQNIRNRNKNAVLEKLYQTNPIDVPNALLESQIRDMQIEVMRRTGAKDVSQAPDREPLVEPARRRVALGLLINDIIRREQLVVDPARANARLDEMVSGYGDAAALKRAYLQNADAMRQVESLALEDQVVDWILAHAEVREKPSSFRELMNFEG